MEYIQVVGVLFLLAAVYGGDLTGYGDSYATPPSSYGVPSAGGYNTGYNNGYNGGYNNGYGYGGSHGSYDEQPKSYQFGYAVRDYASGNDYNRHETSDGNTITGEYRVQLPDGRTQIVSYVADWKNGFRAQVRYEGEARYPTGPSASGYGPPALGYGPPAPSYGTPSPYTSATFNNGGYNGSPHHGGSGTPSSSYGPPGYSK